MSSRNEFDDFPDDAFAGAGAKNEFDSFDDDVFKGRSAAEFDHFDSFTTSSPTKVSPRKESGAKRQPTKQPQEPVTRKPAPPSFPPPPPLDEFEDDEFEIPPHPPSTRHLEEDEFEIPPVAPPPRRQPRPPSSAKPQPPPPPSKPPQAYYPEDDEEDNIAPPPAPPSQPPPPPEDEYETDDYDAAPPSGPPPPPEYGEEIDDEQPYDDGGDFPPPPPPASPPAYDQGDDEDQAESDFPPPPPPPEDDDDQSVEAPAPRPLPTPPPYDEEEEYEDDQFTPPPPTAPPPPHFDENDDSATDEDEAATPPLPPPGPPPSSRALEPRHVRPPPVPKRETVTMAATEAVEPMPSISETILGTAKPVPSQNRPVIVESTGPFILLPTTAPIEKPKEKEPMVRAITTPVILLAPPPPQQSDIELVEDVAEGDDDEEKQDYQPPPPAQSVSRKDSQESLTKIMRPPSHPPPPPNAPEDEEEEEEENVLQNQMSRRPSLLSPNEEKQIALRFLRAVDTQTRTLNRTVIKSARGVYQGCSAMNREGGEKVSFYELAAGVKMIDPELSVDQAVRFVFGLASQAGITPDREHFTSHEEFEMALTRLTGVDVAATATEDDDRRLFVRDEKVDDALNGEDGAVLPSRKLQQYALWIDSLHIWPAILDVVEALKSGVLLCKLVEHLVRQRDDAKFRLRGMNPKPRTRTPSLQNLELALSIVWKQRVVARNMPTADKIYQGDAQAVSNLLGELFTAFALPTSSARDMFEWYHGVLRHYDKDLPDSVRLPPHRGLWGSFGGADSLACVLHFFCGPEGVPAERLPAVDLSRFYLNPARVREVRENCVELFDVLDKCHIGVPWTVEDFVRAQDQDMLLVQLSGIYSRFKDAACAIPLVVPGGIVPVQSKQYVQVSHNGDVTVVGTRFRELAPSPSSRASPEDDSAVDQNGRVDSNGIEVRDTRTTMMKKRSYTGFHTFSSEEHQTVQAHPVSIESGEDMSGEVFFLVSPTMSMPPPPVLSETMIKSSNASLERALARVDHAPALQSSVHHRNSLPAAASFSAEDPVSEMRARMKQRLQPAGQVGGMNASLLAARRASMGNSLVRDTQQAKQHQRHMEERRLFELEDYRRKASLRQERETMAVVDDFQDRVKAAMQWLKTPRDVDFHNRNSVDNCRVFVSKAANSSVLGGSDYSLQWFDVRDESDAGSILLSDVYDVTTTTAEDGTIFIYIHLNRIQAVKTSKGRPSLKLEPVKPQEGLRMFANLQVLLDDIHRRQASAGRYGAEEYEEY